MLYMTLFSVTATNAKKILTVANNIEASCFILNAWQMLLNLWVVTP
jgi:hypothetical protein